MMDRPGAEEMVKNASTRWPGHFVFHSVVFCGERDRSREKRKILR